MITLAILQVMTNDIADLELDENAFWEELPLQSNGKPAQGVWLVTRGGSLTNTPNGFNQKATIDIYVAYQNKAYAELLHGEILEWIRNNSYICDLSGNAGGSGIQYEFKNVRIRPTTTPQNYGATENGNIIKMASADIVYDAIHTNQTN